MTPDEKAKMAAGQVVTQAAHEVRLFNVRLLRRAERQRPTPFLGNGKDVRLPSWQRAEEVMR